MSFALIQNPDGADFQAQAVLAYVRYILADGIEESWDKETKRYLARPIVGRYENCREQGYAIKMRSHDSAQQINIVFYQHRNSDAIVAVVTGHMTINTVTPEQVAARMEDKFDVAHSVKLGDAFQMAQWIVEELRNFWVSTSARG